MEVKVIKNNSDYVEALDQLSKLMDMEFASNSKEEKSLELLLLVIKDYEESIIHPIDVDPIEAIKFRMDQMHFSQKDLVPYIGSISKVSEVLSGKRQLSRAMIRKLHQELGIPLSSLFGVKNDTDKAFSQNPNIDYQQFPLKEMKERGYLQGKLNDIKEYAEERVNAFCGKYQNVLTQSILNQNVALLRAPLHRRGKKRINKYALAIWQICVLKKAEELVDLPVYNPDLIDADWLEKLIKLSSSEEGPKLAKEYLERSGIALVIEPHFQKTFLDGAAMLFNKRPIVALTLRHDRIDNFWFVLAHELAHVIKHLFAQGEKSLFIDDLDEREQLDALEIEADAIANEALIPKKIWDSIKEDLPTAIGPIILLAKKIDIHPSIIAGRIRYEQKNYHLFPKLAKKRVVVNF